MCLCAMCFGCGWMLIHGRSCTYEARTLVPDGCTPSTRLGCYAHLLLRQLAWGTWSGTSGTSLMRAMENVRSWDSY